MRVEQNDAVVDGIQTVDVLQDVCDDFARGSTGGEVVAQCGCECPPAAIVGAFVEIPIENLGGERSQQARIVQDGGDDGLLQIGDRLLECGLCPSPRIADLPQQHACELDRRVRAQGEADVAIPYGAIELALNLLGLQRDAAQLG